MAARFRFDTPAPTRKPRLCVISYHGLSRLVHAVVPEFERDATINVIDVVLDDALATARQLVADDEVDVIISAGANAAILRTTLSVPVVTIKVTGYDLLLALHKARSICGRIGVVSYRETIPELEAVKDLLDVDLSQRAYRTTDDVQQCFSSLAAEGYTVIVGSSLVVDLANKSGSQGILVYSFSSVRQAIEDAIALARVAALEAARYEQLNAVLFHLREAVLAVDIGGRITAMNPAMENMLGLPAAEAIGRVASSIDRNLSLDHVLTTGREQFDEVTQINQATCVANRIPIHEAGQLAGAVLTLQDAQAIQRTESTIRAQRRVRDLSARYHFNQLIGVSPAFQQARASAMRYARTDSTVLITGASGTGKELFAQAIHNAGKRRGNPFVAVNCAAFPEPLLESELFGYDEGAFTGSRKGGKSGLFEAAHKGTIFLDELGDMPLSLQTRLLRVLQEKEVVRLGSTQPIPIDVRVVAATHQPLLQRVEQGAFRADLYYRLNILRLALPTLRERSEDIPLLAEHFLAAALRRLNLGAASDTALATLMPVLHAYHWPGNVRELENVVERIAVFVSDYAPDVPLDHQLLRADLPELYAEERPMPTGPMRVAEDAPAGEVDDEAIRRALERSKGNRKAAAELLGLSRTTLWRRLRSLSASSPGRD